MDDFDDEMETPPNTAVNVQASRILGPRVRTDRHGMNERLGSLKSVLPFGAKPGCENGRGYTSAHSKPIDQLEAFAYRGSKVGEADKGGGKGFKSKVCGTSNGSRRSNITEEGRGGALSVRRNGSAFDEKVHAGVGPHGSNSVEDTLQTASQKQQSADVSTNGKTLRPESKTVIERAAKKRRMIVSDSDEDEEVGDLKGHMKAEAAASSRNGAAGSVGGEGSGNGRKVEHGSRGVEVVEIKDTPEEEEEEEEVVVGEEEESDPVLKVLRTCEGITAKLRRQLEAASGNGNGSAIKSDRYSAVDESAATLVSKADVRAACGEGEVNLKGYQLVGVNFLLLLHRQGMGGGENWGREADRKAAGAVLGRCTCSPDLDPVWGESKIEFFADRGMGGVWETVSAILADEMGLGKTIQAITFLALLAHLDKDRGPHLVVAPASLLENWQREISRWCPSLRTILYHGNGRKEVMQELTEDARRGREPRFDILLVCYSMFERDSAIQKDDRKLLRRFRFSCVLMDEAHLLKDRSTMRTKRLREVAGGAKHRLMLTGTPLQNDLQELWSLLEFLMPTIFTTHGCDLTQFLGTREEGGHLEGEGGGGNLIARIKGILGPFVLRRVKADVMKQLVAKEQKVEVIDMVEEQQAAYELAVEQYKRTVAEKRDKEGGGEGKGKGKMTQVLPRKQLASIFTHLRKVANHPLLVRRLYDDASLRHLAKVLHRGGAFGDECTLQRVEEEIQEYSDFDLHQLCVSHSHVLGKRILPTEVVLCSGKCRALSFLLPRLQREGHRPLLFSQWTSMLDVLQWLLDFLGMTWIRLDGSTAVVERQALVDEYNGSSKIFAFLLSTRAGGQGLNLTGADTVILHDVDFNPQVDRQAEDRCHRIGQTKPVTVYRMVTRGTVDESILKIAQRKLSLDAAVLDSGANEKVVAESDTRTMGDILSSLLDH